MKSVLLIIFVLISLSASSMSDFDKLMKQVSEKYYTESSEDIDKMLDEAYKLAVNNNSYEQKLTVIKEKIKFYNYKNDFDAGYSYFEKGLELAQNFGNKKDVAEIYISFGPSYREIGLYDKAIDLYMKAENILKDEKGCEEQKYTLFLNLSSVFLYKGDYKKSIEYVEYSLNIAQDLKDNAKMYNSYFFKANVMLEMDELDSAVVNYQKCISILDKSNNKSDYAEVLNNLGLVYQKKENYKKAEEYFLSSYEIAKEINYFLLEAYIENELGDLYRIMGDFQKSEKFFKLSLEKEKEADYIVLTQSLYDNVHMLYKESGDYKQSLFFFEKYHSITDSLNKVNNDKNIMEVETKFRTKEKENEINLLNKENELKHSQIVKRNWIITMSLVLIGLVLVLMILAFKSRKNQILANKELSKKNDEIAHQKEEITDSINYARIIQNSIFGKEDKIKEMYSDSAIFHRPKDIVSGDFFWMHKNNDKFIFTVADCTGHGVPGAMVSMIGNNALNESVKVHGMTSTSDILNHLSNYVNKAFSDNETKNGMDIALCSIDLKTQELEYSGAFNPLFVFKSNGEVVEIKADKKYIGQEDSVYSSTKIQLEPGDCIYVMSDGYCDQFGGQNGKKFKISRFKEMAKANVNKSAEEQKQIIAKEFDLWKGSSEQVDDICVAIIKI